MDDDRKDFKIDAKFLKLYYFQKWHVLSSGIFFDLKNNFHNCFESLKTRSSCRKFVSVVVFLFRTFSSFSKSYVI